MTEAELCDRLRAWGEAAGFEVYPEVAYWGLVLVARMDRSIDRLDWSAPGSAPAAAGRSSTG